MADIPLRAQTIIERLAAIDYSRGEVDRPRVEAALMRHLDLLRQPPRPVRWFGDLAAARAAARDAAWDAAWDAARAAARDAARDAAWAAARDAARAAARDAARDAAWAADPVIKRFAEIEAPFVDAWEAGLWIYWITPKQIIACPRPALHLDGLRIHRADGPAMYWDSPNGARFWFWQGVRVAQHVIEAPEKITVAEIDAEANVEVRRVLVERYGSSRFLLDGGAKEVSRDGRGILYRRDLPGDEQLVMVRVQDSTDGREYFLRVPPTMTAPTEAIAWSFEMTSEEYAPSVET